MLLTIDDRGSKNARNSVLDCHLLPTGQQMTIENSVSIDFLSTFFDSINLFECRLPGVSKVQVFLIVNQGRHRHFNT